jgi:putative ABC transport system permease protein
MFINYIIVAWRNLSKNRMVSLINILGLTLGLASAVLALLYARHELTFENCHEKADRIAKVYISGEIGQLQIIPTTFGPEGEALKGLFPEVELNSISLIFQGIVRVGENLFSEDDLALADSAFFSIFTVPFKEGTFSPNPQTVVLSEKAAQRYFGKESPVGQNITITCHGQKIDFLVTGVYKDFPSNTHLRAEFIIPFSLAKRFEFLKYTEYYGTNYHTYLLLQQGTDIKDLNKKILASYKIPVNIENIAAFLMPIKEIRFKGTFENNKGKLMVFLVGGFFMLFTSCINYVNLTNILFSARGKETGIRKVNGGKRINIIMQFLSDTALSALIGFNLAILILKLMLPWFNAIMDTHLSLVPDMGLIGLGLMLFSLTVLLSGLYPALRYSSLKPVKLISLNSAEIRGRSPSRWILTTFQFLLAVIFIQFMMVMSNQNKFIFSDDIKKYNSDNVICLPGHPWGDLKKVKQALLKNPAIETVSWGSTIPTMGFNYTSEWKDEHNKVLAMQNSFGLDYLKAYRIKMASGRYFSDEFSADRENSIIINQIAANELGLDDPVNKMMYAFEKQYKIIGVIDNYMALPPIFENTPLLIRQSGDQGNYLIIRINPVNPEATHEYIVNTLHEFNPDYPIDIKYHIDILMEQKESKSYITAGKLMTLFFILTIITSLVGLFGLSVFIAERHRKEVGIRKVCGASALNIIFKLSKGLLIQILIVLGIATPLSFFFTEGYLSIYPVHFEPGLFFYLFGGTLGSLVLILTVSWQTWRAANRNPVEELRYE